MLTRYASELAGDAGTLVRLHCKRKGALIAFSEVVPTEDKAIRFCDIGGNTSEALESAVVEITQWLFQLGFEGWVIKAVVPERIAASWRSPKIVAGWKWRGFHHTVDPLSGMCRSATHTSALELEPAEQESVLSIRSKSMATGLRAAVRAIHLEMYTPDTSEI
ncbi:hypothetical protein BGZ95_003717 [Linnemannia exigua]|uniref:Uncharacterized protein n=1 Tax=Linnemannia exigua TaxID=604196 RepID=A0AAD4H239_9FUNG|nr:hypothetical protein BGZ95_003717 [Linnemannia exigua]